jgi:DNA topoisomerase I
MNLVIVESPTKAKTITKFLGKEYKVESSFGHIRDLPKSTLGVETEKDFEPKYVIPTKNRKNLNNLKKLAEKADKVILATDEDREGEAIAWHLSEAIGLESERTKRIVFHEITKKAILEALENSRSINMHLVDAQQARRVLDRLVGYELSPFLWKKVAKGLSAGRVQSVAVRLIVEREREIKAFVPQEYWGIEAFLKKNDSIIQSRLNRINGKTVDKLEIKTKEEADKILENIANAEFKVAKIEKKTNSKKPPAPFTTSTLQQAANRMLGFSAKQTMMLAQQLYEGIEGAGDGSGLITYMRTDSLNLAESFMGEAKTYLENNLGKEYALTSPRYFKTKSKGAQEAHEAIRPTRAMLSPEEVKTALNDRQFRLYRLIWQRALASQMPEASLDSTTVDFDAGETGYQFRANGQIIKFKGYLKIYPEKSKELILPEMAEGETLETKEIKIEQHFTKPPARYSDAGLVKELEKFGIGRPSTYAPTIATIEARNYVSRDDNKKLMPNDIAFIVIDLLVKHFPKIVDFEFTANMENDLDRIAAGETEWQPIIKDFYEPFHSNLEKKYEEVNKDEVVPVEETKEKCDKCGAPMIIKTGRYGKFLACSAFPECRNIKGLNGDQNKSDSQSQKKVEELQKKYEGETCAKCGSPMAVKTGRFGPFLACTAYPKCKNIKNITSSENAIIDCPECKEGKIVPKRSKRGLFYACDRYPDCKKSFWAKPLPEKCPECKSHLVENKNGKKCSNKECGYEE